MSTELLKSIIDKKPTKIQTAFNDEMKDKIMSKVNVKRAEIGANIMASQQKESIEESLAEYLEEAKTINIDDIKDKKLNKKAWGMLKKKQKAFYSAEDQDVKSWNDLKNDVDSRKDLEKYTDYASVVAPGKEY